MNWVDKQSYLKLLSTQIATAMTQGNPKIKKKGFALLQWEMDKLLNSLIVHPSQIQIP